jgi:hypothetical protein
MCRRKSFLYLTHYCMSILWKMAVFIEKPLLQVQNAMKLLTMLPYSPNLKQMLTAP